MENLEILDFELDDETLYGDVDPEEQKEIGAARFFLRPRAAYRAVPIAARLESALIVDGVRLESRLLPKLTEKANMVFPYVLTIGRRLEARIDALKDAAARDRLDRFGNAALEAARNRLEERLRSVSGIEMLSYLSPGSLKEWPIGEQKALFSLLGRVESSVGVRIDRSGYMIPRKSTSGIYFETEKRFFSCLLCPQKDCPLRKVEYEEELAVKHGTIK